MATPRRLFCFGLGYSALALARVLMDDGWTVAGTSRSDDTAAALSREGIEVLRFDREHPLPDAAGSLAGVTHLLSSVPPDDAGDPVVDCHGDAIGAVSGLQWAGYLSTTGVYGDHDGGWVDETTPLTPTGVRGRRRVTAEQAWLDLYREHGTPVHLFRLAGIYGPGCNALVTVRGGRAHRTVKPGQVFSRIHRDDIVETLRASIRKPNPGAAYNLSDDEAAAPQDVIAYACDLLGVAPPPEVDIDAADLSPMAQSFYRDNKRVRNDRIKQELGVVLRWPTYREGLAALLADEG